ncbi:MAG TPA: FG-GAP-like repeat-containing protein [Planctomycetota bacterium]
MCSRSSLLPLLLALLAGPATAQIGTVRASQRINGQLGGFTGPLEHEDWFGSELAPLGDLDGDGVPDLAVGAPGDDDGGPERGAVWILFLKPDRTVARSAKISQTSGGFAGVLADRSAFGSALARVDDLDGDGVPELVVWSGQPNRLHVLLLNADGTLHGQREILAADAAFGGQLQARFLAPVLTALGDLDHDGFPDLALGTPEAHARAGGLWILRLGPGGAPRQAHEIAELIGGFTGDLQPSGSGFGGDALGTGIALLGDLDGNGCPELGVTAPGAEPRGSFWVLYLDASERVFQHSQFGAEEYGVRYRAGSTQATRWASSLGDLDGDGRDELVLDFSNSFDLPGGGRNDTAAVITFLHPDGSARVHLPLGNESGGMGAVPTSTGFGCHPRYLGDLDGDGAPELAVGALYDRVAGVDTGAVWILTLATDFVRDGSLPNPRLLSQAADPAIGQLWSVTLDCSGHAPGFATFAVYDRPGAGVFRPEGEVLVAGHRLAQYVLPNAGVATTITLRTPRALDLVGLRVHVQGLCAGAPAALSNALDLLIGE